MTAREANFHFKTNLVKRADDQNPRTAGAKAIQQTNLCSILTLKTKQAGQIPDPWSSSKNRNAIAMFLDLLEPFSVVSSNVLFVNTFEILSGSLFQRPQVMRTKLTQSTQRFSSNLHLCQDFLPIAEFLDQFTGLRVVPQQNLLQTELR